MSVYRLADVAAELHGIEWISRPAILVNEEDQRALLLDKFTPWDINRARGGHDFAEHAHKSRVTLCLIRAWVPRVHENSTGWLIRPMWPTVGSESQNSARVDRLHAYANGSDDHATLEALAVRHSLVSRARIITALVLKGAEGQRRLAQSLPTPDFMNVQQMTHVLNELQLCGLWQNVETMRARCESRTRQLGRECCNEWHAWRAYEENYHRAAVAYVWLVHYLFDIVPRFEAIMAEDDEEIGLEDGRKWQTVSCCDPVFYNLDPDDKDDKEKIEDGCSICMGGNDYCRLKKLDCNHSFGESCLLTWYQNRDELGEPRTCPLCRKLSYNADAFACHVCTATGFSVQLYHLNGACRCDTVYCKDHLPTRSQPCGGCGVYSQE
jgi:hypothetical protein